MARRSLLVLLVCVACSSSGGGVLRPLLSSSPSVVTPAPQPSDLVLVPVTKVTDGDTIHVRYLGVDERVRLIGVDTPEVPWYGGQGECFGVEAGEYTQRRLTGRSVGLEFDADLRDRYERLLAYVFVDGELFNLTLVQQGYARADPVPPDTSREALFAGAEAQAKAAGLGLWSACPG